MNLTPSMRAALASSEDLQVRAIQYVPSVLREMGVSPAAVLRAAGLKPNALTNLDRRLPFTQVGRLAVECVNATGCQHFGLIVGERAGPVAAGIIHELMRFTTNVHAALCALRAHLHLHDRGAVVTLTDAPDDQVEVAYVIHHHDTIGSEQITDGGIAVMLLLLQSLLGPRWAPTCAAFARSRPPDIAPYARLFRAPLAFDAPRTALFIPRSLLDHAIPGSDSRREAAIRELIARAEAANPRSLSLRVKELLSAMLVESEPTFDQVATAFGTSRRTLRRRLALEGTSVTALRNEIKAEFARQLLVNSTMSIIDIGATLHYTKPGAFSRAYKGWTGASPQEARRNAGRR